MSNANIVNLVLPRAQFVLDDEIAAFFEIEVEKRMRAEILQQIGYEAFGPGFGGSRRIKMTHSTKSKWLSGTCRLAVRLKGKLRDILSMFSVLRNYAIDVDWPTRFELAGPFPLVMQCPGPHALSDLQVMLCNGGAGKNDIHKVYGRTR